ncbi:hypothetical protein HK100_006410, partial [Physocladia obscura]
CICGKATQPGHLYCSITCHALEHGIRFTSPSPSPPPKAHPPQPPQLLLTHNDIRMRLFSFPPLSKTAAATSTLNAADKSVAFLTAAAAAASAAVVEPALLSRCFACVQFKTRKHFHGKVKRGGAGSGVAGTSGGAFGGVGSGT